MISIWSFRKEHVQKEIVGYSDSELRQIGEYEITIDSDDSDIDNAYVAVHYRKIQKKKRTRKYDFYCPDVSS